MLNYGSYYCMLCYVMTIKRTGDCEIFAKSVGSTAGGVGYGKSI